MKKYSVVLGLMAIVTAMVIFQIGAHEVGASRVTFRSQSNEMGLPTITGGLQMVPMHTRLAMGKENEDTKVGDSGEKSDKPDLRTVESSEAPSLNNCGGNGKKDGDDEDKGDGEDKKGEAKDKKDEGGFDRLWEVISNG